jgi:hypothetical protein
LLGYPGVPGRRTAAFDKFGVRSRRELAAAMLTGRPG